MRITSVLALALLFIATPVVAQGPRLEVSLPPTQVLAIEGPTVRASGIMDDRALRDLLRSGFPAWLHFRVERWTAGGWFNALKEWVEWDVVVRFDPLGGTYHVARATGERMETLGDFTEFSAVISEVERPVRVPLKPSSRRERQYYRAVLEVEVISLSDLDEVERWLRGELQPAVRGKKSPGTAVTRGVRTLMVRLLGGEKRRLEERTPTFRPQ